MMIAKAATHPLLRPGAGLDHYEKLFLALLVFGALAGRLLMMVFLRTYEFSDEWEIGYEMGQLGQSLANDQGFILAGRPSVWMAPLYPFVLSVIFRLFGSYTLSAVVAILVVQSLASSLMIIPLYFIGKRLFNRSVGFISGLLWVFHPGALRYAVHFIWSSSFTALGLILIIWFFLKLQDSPPRALDAFLGGLTIAITALSNPVVLAVVPLALVWLFWRSQADKKIVLQQIGLIVFTTVIFLIPWTVRNYTTFHQFIPVKGTFGFNLWQGNHPDVNQEWAGLGAWSELSERLSKPEVTRLANLNEVERSRVLQMKAAEFIINNPEKFAKYTIQRIQLFWTLSFRALNKIGGGGAQIILSIFSVYYFGFRILTVLGIMMSWQRWRETSLLLLLLIIYPLPYYLTIADTYRYRFPIEGVMFVFVAYAIYHLLTLVRLKTISTAGKVAV